MASVACEIWGFLVSSDFFGILYQLSSRGFEIPMHFLGTSVCMPLHTRAWPACSAPDSSKKEGPCATIRWQPHAFGQLGGKGAAGARHLRCRAHVIVLANTRLRYLESCFREDFCTEVFNTQSSVRLGPASNIQMALAAQNRRGVNLGPMLQ